MHSRFKLWSACCDVFLGKRLCSCSVAPAVLIFFFFWGGGGWFGRLTMQWSNIQWLIQGGRGDMPSCIMLQKPQQSASKELFNTHIKVWHSRLPIVFPVPLWNQPNWYIMYYTSSVAGKGRLKIKTSPKHNQYFFFQFFCITIFLWNIPTTLMLLDNTNHYFFGMCLLPGLPQFIFSCAIF